MSPFDPNKYTRQIEEARRRLEITARFQEPDRAPIRIGAPGGGFILAIGGETYYGVPPEYLIRAVAYAKEIGRYPIEAVSSQPKS